nr:MAG TPA: Protein gp18.1, prophage tail protein gp18.7A [Caudoviricetes sp.]
MGITQIIKRNGETIQLNTNEPFCFVKEATLTSSLMGDDYISLKIVSSNWLSFAKGDKITVGGKEYSIRATTTREVVSEGYYNYEPVFYGVMYDLMKTIYRNCDKYGKSDKSTFDLTYTIKEFVQVLIYNMERDYPGLWKFDVDNCPDTEARTIQFSGVNCLQALQTLCNSEQFNLEFQITQDKGVRTIHIGKFGKRINPPSGADFFEWGKGNGLYNLKEQKIDDKAIITRLWAEGGTTNIRSNYREYSERLQLPYPQRKNQYEHTLSDGTIVKVGTETIGIADDAKRYIEDAELRDKIGSEEDVKTYDNIYPTRTGTVTAVVADDICAFIDDTMDFDLNKKDDKGTVYLVDGTSAKITFTSGRLAGQQFELEAKGGYNHETKKFRIIPFTDNRGLTIPSAETQDAYRIEVGNTYKITDIYLPESYEQKAEEALWYAAMEDFKTATQAKAQYTLTLDRLYFLQELSRDTDTSVFEVGDYVPVKDTRFGIEKQMRIQKVTRNLLLKQDYQITLADTTTVSIQTQTVLTVIEHENIINNNRLRDLNKARRGWRTTEDLRNMVYDTDGYFDTGNIKPNSIDTNMLTVGAKSQQFVLSGCVLQANFGGNPNMFVATAGILSHLTIDNNKIRNWQMNEASFQLQSTGGYYLFAKCSKSGENGVWYLTQEQLKFEPTSDLNNYYFQVGIVSSLYADDNFRDFQTTYGFTRINGNTITTGRIITSDGECYLDLDDNKFRIGDSKSSIDWNVSAESRLTLKNVSVASGSGDVVPLGVYRGVWNKDYIYYTGDEVAYTSNGATCTYRYIHPTPSKGNLPTNSTYWEIVAQGADGNSGNNGDWVSFVFKESDTKPATPTSTASIPDGWSDTPSATGKWWMSKATINGVTGKAGKWSEPVQTTAEDGVDGAYTDFKYAKNTSSTSFPAIVTSDRNPSGWSDEPPTLSTGEYLWMSQAEINADGTLKTNWSTPVRISGEKGNSGNNGSVFYFIYTLASTTPSTPAFTTPSALVGQTVWTIKPQTPTDTLFLYMSQAIYNPNTGRFGSWTAPIRISGKNGEKGADGTDIEFIYLRNTGSTPSKPTSVNTDDYVPSGWTDSPQGITETYKYEWVCVRTKPSGTDTWSAFSTPVIWAKWGDKGTDGDGTEYIFQRTEVEKAPSKPNATSSADGFVPTGWTDEPSGVSADYPFEWVSVRHKTNGSWGFFSTPTLWNNYVVWNPNLLEQTEFESIDRLDKWDVVSCNHGGSGIDTSIAHINTSGVDGHNCFYDANTKRNDESVYKEVLRQVLQSSTTKKLKPSTWYTLSFWAKCGTNTLTVNETSSAYGFAQRTLYLRSGRKYTFSFNGRINAQAKSDGKELRCFIWQDGWKWQKEISVSNTYNTTASISFDDVPADGVYHFAAYLYDSTDPRTGKATLNWVRILETGGTIFSTYVFPSAIDTTKVFVDGVQYNNTIGADCVVDYPTYTAWKKHTITFKTKASFADTEYVLFRLQPIIIEGNSQYLYICMPKLELGKVATAYDANSNDNRPDYQEYRFAKNGSRNSAPALVKTDAEPSGWTTTQPNVGTLEYLWMIVAKKSGTGALLENWSEPVRITPYDGKDGENGKSPAMVYRGVYDSSKTYYGNQYRVDAVKYNGIYYIARIDAGEFYNVAPTNTSKWNNFGAQFESIATNLLLAEGANIGDWFISKGKIVSTLERGNKITLDAKGGEILLETSNNGGDNVMSEYQGVYGANIKASLNDGTVEVRSKKNSSLVSYISPTGVFSNMAGTDGMPLSSGYTHRGAVVGLGFANVKKREWAVNAVDTIVAGVYGRADNSGTAPAYGGFFYDLYAGGLTLGRKCITENGNSGHSSYLSSDDSIVIGYSRYAETVYLPSDPKEGQVIFVKQWWSGSLNIYPLTGHHIYDDTSENTYYPFSEGQGGMFVFTIGYVNGVKKEAWIVSRWKS